FILSTIIPDKFNHFQPINKRAMTLCRRKIGCTRSNPLDRTNLQVLTNGQERFRHDSSLFLTKINCKGANGKW
ncbi:MAG: hypothetical protein KDE52_13920, partial [Calditrichaeota bacterium]|nr:hypothetical protein [Calditrichota bacterium]